MEIHVGHKVRQRAKELRIGATELGRLVNTSRSNIYWIYDRKHIDVQMLMKLSRILKFNFFAIYQDEMVLEKINASTSSTERSEKLYKFPSDEINRLQTAVAELREKYNVLEKSLKKKERKK